MSSTDLRRRTKDFALRIIQVANALPANRAGDTLGRQVLKSGTSVGANWREACRASSKRHFITTAEICRREADETLYWLELLTESKLIKPTRLESIMDECNQLVAILAATVKTAKRNLPAKRQNPRSPTF